MRPMSINVVLAGDEAEALRRAAIHDLRQPKEQARFLIREELNRRGLLPQENANRAGKVVEATPSATAN